MWALVHNYLLSATGAEKAGFIKPLPSGRLPRIDHVGFGLVLGEDGKKIATRSGEVRLISLTAFEFEFLRTPHKGCL